MPITTIYMSPVHRDIIEKVSEMPHSRIIPFPYMRAWQKQTWWQRLLRRPREPLAYVVTVNDDGTCIALNHVQTE